jgi:tRNA G10  N-methylase Trm11
VPSPIIPRPSKNHHDYAAATHRYNGHRTTAGMLNCDIMELYRAAMREASRVLKPEGGTLWVKCKDEVERAAAISRVSRERMS